MEIPASRAEFNSDGCRSRYRSAASRFSTASHGFSEFLADGSSCVVFSLRKQRKGTEENGTWQPARAARAEYVADYTVSRPLALLGFEQSFIADGRET